MKILTTTDDHYLNNIEQNAGNHNKLFKVYNNLLQQSSEPKYPSHKCPIEFALFGSYPDHTPFQDLAYISKLVEISVDVQIVEHPEEISLEEEFQSAYRH